MVIKMVSIFNEFFRPMIDRNSVTGENLTQKGNFSFNVQMDIVSITAGESPISMIWSYAIFI